MFISAYSDKPRVQFKSTLPSRTKQAFKAECDINTIIARFLKTGVMDFQAKMQPRYGDCTGIEYQAAMQTVAAAQSLFAAMPASLRDRFENEPAKFLDFVQDPENAAEARELGLLKPEAKPAEPAATPPAPTPAPTAPAAPAAA